MNIIPKLIATIFIISLVLVFTSPSYLMPTSARPKVAIGGPVVSDPNLRVDLVVSGLKAPTSISFLGQDDILLTEKNTGLVQRVVKGAISGEPLVQLNVSKLDER